MDIDELKKGIVTNPVETVDNTAILHLKLTDAALLLNLAFCVQLLSLIIIAFVGIVISLFLLAADFAKTAIDIEEDMIVIFSLWTVTNILQLIGVVYVTCELTEEVSYSICCKVSLSKQKLKEQKRRKHVTNCMLLQIMYSKVD